MEPQDPPSGHSPCGNTIVDGGGEESILHPSESDKPSMRLSTAVLRQKLKRMALKQLNASQAAQLVGCGYETARRQYADPEFRREVHDALDEVFGNVDAAYAKKQQDMHELLNDQAYRSFNDLMTMLEQEDLQPALRVKINQDFLDRSAESTAYAPRAASADAQTLQIAARAAREMDNVIEIRKTG